MNKIFEFEDGGTRFTVFHGNDFFWYEIAENFGLHDITNITLSTRRTRDLIDTLTRVIQEIEK
jgi:hypothetical protein